VAEETRHLQRTPAVDSPPIANDAAAVWVVVERASDGRPTASTLELLGEAAWLSRRLGGDAVAVALDAQLASPEVLARHGADRVLHLVAPELGRSAPETKAAALSVYLHTLASTGGGSVRRSPHAILFSASECGRDVAPRLAARLGLGLTGDCIGLTLDPDRRLLADEAGARGWHRGADLVASTPQLATVRPDLPRSRSLTPRALRVETVAVRCLPSRDSVARVVLGGGAGLAEAEGAAAIVAVGTGIGG
jgi:electron transfer flavoprotein alpha subunit